MRPSLWGKGARRGGCGRNVLLFGLGFTLLATVSPVLLAGQDAGGSGYRGPPLECCLVLLLPVGGRASAMAGATTAFGSPDAVFGNPAGLASVHGKQFILHHEPLLTNQQANAFSILFTPPSVGTLGLTYQLFDYGEEEARDRFNNVTGRISTREHVLFASFATEVRGGLDAGLTYKLYQFRIDCAGSCAGGSVAGTTHALDGGFRLRTPSFPHVLLGAAITNVGSSLQMVNAEQADPMPSRVKVGAAYEVLHPFVTDTAYALWLTLEAQDRLWYPGNPETAVAAELSAADVLYIRAGYRGGEGRGTGAALGLGFVYGRFALSVSRTFTTTGPQLSEPYQFSLGITF